MKLLVKAAVAAVLAVPVVSFAQSSQPALTRAEVRAHLAQVEQAGYNPNDYINFPANLQRAETIVAQQNNGNTAYGADTSGSSQAGR
jgi:opacity protein-like surface antigen